MRDQLHSCFAYPLPPCMLPTGPQPPPSSQPLYSPRHRSALPLLPPPSRLTLAQPTPPLPAVIRLPDSLVKKALAKRARPLNRHPPSLPTRSHRQLLAAYAFQEGVTAEYDNSTGFFSLPVEIRTRIYELAFGQPWVGIEITIPGLSRPGDPFDLHWNPAEARRRWEWSLIPPCSFDSSLLRTCRLIYLEACHLLFHNITLRFADGMHSVIRFARCLHPRYWPWARELRRISIATSISHETYGFEGLWCDVSGGLEASAIFGGVTNLNFDIVPQRFNSMTYPLVASTPRPFLSELEPLVKFVLSDTHVFFPALLTLKGSTVALFQNGREIREEDLPDDCQLRKDLRYMKEKIFRGKISQFHKVIALACKYLE